MGFLWGWVAEGPPESGDWWQATHEGRRLFVIKGRKIEFPEAHRPGWIFNRVSARGYLTVEPFNYTTWIDDCVSEDGIRFAVPEIKLTLKIRNDEDCWRDVIRRRAGIEDEVHSTVERVFRQAGRTVSYKRLKMRDLPAEEKIQAAVARGVASVAPYELRAVSFVLRSNEPALDEAIDSARNLGAIEGEQGAIQAIKERDIARMKEIARLDAEARHDLDLFMARNRGELARIAEEYNLAVSSMRDDSEAARFRKLGPIYENPLVAILLKDPKLYIQLQKAILDKNEEYSHLEGMIKAFGLLIGKGDLTPDRKEISLNFGAKFPGGEPGEPGWGGEPEAPDEDR